MKTTFRTYDPDQDFMRIRDFLIKTFALYQRPFNWLIDRWNFCRYFAVPVHTHYNMSYFGVPTHTHPPFRDEVPVWEQAIGIWENEAGNIAGAIQISGTDRVSQLPFFITACDYTLIGEDFDEEPVASPGPVGLGPLVGVHKKGTDISDLHSAAISLRQSTVSHWS